MHPNEELIHSFYKAFQKKEYATMQKAYTSNALFSDPVFPKLTANEVKAMWEFFCVTGNDVHIEYTGVVADDAKGSAEWTATYVFSKTGRKVVNKIKASYTFINGAIIEHSDSFSFYNWAKQAFGFTGLLLGNTLFFKNKVREMAYKNLNSFIKKRDANRTSK